MTSEIFLTGLLIVAILTGLFTEGIKKFIEGTKVTIPSNALAGCVAIVLSILVSAAYIILAEAVLNAQMAVYLIALTLLSWLAAMVGYDKVIQAISQIKK